MQYTAPEYFLGESGSPRSDMFSLGVITYQMLTGKLPYGAQVAKARTRSQLRKLRYRPAIDEHREIPAWIDGALRKAVHPDPYKRYDSLSEYTFDLRQPNAELSRRFAAADRAQSVAVLEMRDRHPGMRRDRVAGLPARRVALGPQASSVTAIIGLGAAPAPGLTWNS